MLSLHLQGPDTDRKAVDEIRRAVKGEAETTVRLLNYRKNGEPFWNMFTIAPMADADGRNRFFIGIQVCPCLLFKVACTGCCHRHSQPPGRGHLGCG